MGIIKEPLHIDFEVDSRPLTKEEEVRISEFIKKRKDELSQKKLSVKKSRAKKEKV